MVRVPLSSQHHLGRALRRACVVLLPISLGGCLFGSGSEDLYKPGDIHIEARQETLSQDVSTVDERSRELKERFNALERLYVDLIRETEQQNSRLAAIEDKVNQISGTSASSASLTRLSNEITELQTAVKAFEGRLFSIELNGVPRSQSGSLSPLEASANSAVGDSGAGTVTADADPDRIRFGVHLGSYRSLDQVPGSWAAFQRVFDLELGSLNARVYTQTQAGIGDFLRLIAGPLETQKDAESLCRTIKARAREQYCETSEFQGDPLP